MSPLSEHRGQGHLFCKDSDTEGIERLSLLWVCSLNPPLITRQHVPCSAFYCTHSDGIPLALDVACSPHQLQLSFGFPKHIPACSGHSSKFLLPSPALLPPPDCGGVAPICDLSLSQCSPIAQHMPSRPSSSHTARERVCLGWGNVPHHKSPWQPSASIPTSPRSFAARQCPAPAKPQPCLTQGLADSPALGCAKAWARREAGAGLALPLTQ